MLIKEIEFDEGIIVFLWNNVTLIIFYPVADGMLEKEGNGDE